MLPGVGVGPQRGEVAGKGLEEHLSTVALDGLAEGFRERDPLGPSDGREGGVGGGVDAHGLGHVYILVHERVGVNVSRRRAQGSSSIERPSMGHELPATWDERGRRASAPLRDPTDEDTHVPMVLRFNAAPVLLLAIAACGRSTTRPHPAASSPPAAAAAASHVSAETPEPGLAHDVPNVITTPAALARAIRLERAWEAAGKPRTSVIDKALTSVFAQAENAKIDLAAKPPYTGADDPAYRDAATASITHLPDLALACALRRGVTAAGTANPACRKGVEILTAWATARSATGQLPGEALSAGTCPAQITEAGLTISRYFGFSATRIRLLASDMSKTQRDAVTGWFHALGRSIKTAHECWLRAHKAEGPNDHLPTHVFGMTVAGLLSHDAQLVRYATEDPANTFNFVHLVDVGIYEKDNPANEFRQPALVPLASLSQDYQDPKYATQPVDLTFGGNKNVRTGEIWDRYRHIDCGHPETHSLELRGCGFAYSMGNLRPLVLTAHMLAANGMTQPGGQTFIHAVDDSILNALRFYGSYFEQIPAGSDADKVITDPIYHREVPSPDDLEAFIVAAPYFPAEGIFGSILGKNAKGLVETGNAWLTVLFAPANF